VIISHSCSNESKPNKDNVGQTSSAEARRERLQRLVDASICRLARKRRR
jgi:hypothetical protein